MQPAIEKIMIKLGSRVKDSISGFTGIATMRTEHLYGCVHVGIAPEKLMLDGQPGDTKFFDEQRIIVIEEKGPEVSKDSGASTGGPSLGGHPPELSVR